MSDPEENHVESADERTALTDAEELGPDHVEVAFASGDSTKGDESKVNITTSSEESKKAPEFAGLSKEELAKFADDPFWVKMRYGMLILFWVLWAGMLAAAIVIIVLAPRCPPRPQLTWYQKASIYQVYPRSFQDSDGNGVGDLKGIESRLDYLKSLNVTALWINAFYKDGGSKSKRRDFGYDWVDHKAVDEDLGTIDDFTSLVRAAHRRGIKVIIDFIPNHTSEKHPWFQASRKDSTNKYRDYYVWNKKPAKNWRNVFGAPAWSQDSTRGEAYYHAGFDYEPDLNLANDAVVRELDKVIQFWLSKGVDGINVVDGHLLVETNHSKDEPLLNSTHLINEYDKRNHTYTTYQAGTFALLARWRAIVDSVTSSDPDHPRALITEARGATPQQLTDLYHYQGKPGVHLAIASSLRGFPRGNSSGSQLHQSLSDVVTEDLTTTRAWTFGGHDVSRIATRISPKLANAANMLGLLLPGAAITYYGQELAMNDIPVMAGKQQDGNNWADQAEMSRLSRDPERTPMMWNGSINAGFTRSKTPWLPLSQDWKVKNVKSQRALGAGLTAVEVYSMLANLRSEPSFQWGKTHFTTSNKNTFSFVRQAYRYPGYLVAINFGKGPTTEDFRAGHMTHVPSHGEVVAHTASFTVPSQAKELGIGARVKLNNVHLQEGSGIVFKWSPEAIAPKK